MTSIFPTPSKLTLTVFIQKLRHDFSYNEKTTNNDIALLKLKKKIDFKKFAGKVAPVCLPDLPRKYYGKTVTKDS